MTAVLRYAPLLLAVWGWSFVALGAHTSVVGLACSALGFIAAALRRRAARATSILEGTLLCVAIALSPSERLAFSAIGLVLVVAGAVIAVRTDGHGAS